MFKIFKKKNVIRKVRTDKKVHVGPTVSIELKQEVERLSCILNFPVKDLGVVLCDYGLRNLDVIMKLSPYFSDVVPLKIGNTVFFGSSEHEIPTHFENDVTERISIRFPQEKYRDIQLIARIMDVTPSKAAAILIDASISQLEIIESLLKNFNNRHTLDEETKKELKRFMKFVNKKRLLN